MARRALQTACLIVVTGVMALAQAADEGRLREGLTAALTPALPFPPASPDGTPEGGDQRVLWVSRWAADRAQLEVLANPLNEENRQRALAAEEAIQKAAMQSQRRSQADYERALSDFQRTGRTGEIREITLQDEGVAGEQYDAESQLTVTAEPVTEARTLTVASGEPLVLERGRTPSHQVVRVSANVYVEGGPDGISRFCAEQAWVVIGPLQTRLTPQPDQPATSLELRPSSDGAQGLLISIRGNAQLLQRVLDAADWRALDALVHP